MLPLRNAKGARQQKILLVLPSDATDRDRERERERDYALYSGNLSE
jgi:hypothetical protein